jgi:hypothetical protein
MTDEDIPTIIEYRDENGKLHDGHFDETMSYIRREVLNWVEQGCTQFKVIKNDRNYNFHWLNNYE